jgi:hypothetical protein
MAVEGNGDGTEMKKAFRESKKEILPKRLLYLQPFCEFLKKLPRADVDETADTTLLEDLLRKRLRGMGLKKAKDELTSDLNELEIYLSAPRLRNDRLHFVVGFLLIAAEKPEVFLKPPEKPRVILERLTMETPPKAKSSIDEYSLNIKWKRQNFHALRLNMEDEFSRKRTLVELEHPNASEYELLNLLGFSRLAESMPPSARQIQQPQAIAIRLGNVMGHKRVSLCDAPSYYKRVEYLLKIPGGYVSVFVSAKQPFDESEWDLYLATLRFQIKAP